MKRNKISLANKVLLFTITFTVFLFTVIILIFYLGGKKYIKNEEIKSIKFYTKLIDLSLKEEIKNSKIELNGLADQLYGTVRVPGNGFSTQQKQIVNNFFIGYPLKYSRIWFLDLRNNYVMEAKPVRVFGGEIETDFMSGPIENVDDKILKYLDKNHSKQDTTFYPDKIITNKNLYILINNKNNLIVAARLRYDYLFNKFIEHASLPVKISLALVDYSGNIVYSTQNRISGQLINTALPNLSGSFEEFLKNKNAQYFFHPDEITFFKSLDNLGLILLFQDNLSAQHSSLNQLAKYALLFSLLMFVIVFAVTKILTRQLGESVNTITDVAKRVGNGDLNQKINIKRDDEIGFLIDTFNNMIVDLKKNYQALKITNEELESKIEELVRTKNELSKKEKLAIIGETVSNISHEIQNKISGISVWVQNLEYQLTSDETSKMYINEIKNALNSFLEMLRNFKKFYRMPALERKKIDVQRLLETVTTNCSAEIRKKKLKLDVVYGDGIKPLLGDEKLLEEVFINLLINAINFSPEGELLEIRAWQNETNIIVRIIDRGRGIKPEDREKIFQPFYTTKQDGSGLGLAIVRNIVDAHHGEIKVKSGKNAGACFEVLLPVQ